MHLLHLIAVIALNSWLLNHLFLGSFETPSAPFRSPDLFELVTKLNRWQTVNSLERMWRGNLIISELKIFFNSDVDLDPHYEPLGQTLTNFTKPTSKCGGFINDVPEVEVRIQVFWFFTWFFRDLVVDLGSGVVEVEGMVRFRFAVKNFLTVFTVNVISDSNFTGSDCYSSFCCWFISEGFRSCTFWVIRFGCKFLAFIHKNFLCNTVFSFVLMWGGCWARTLTLTDIYFIGKVAVFPLLILQLLLALLKIIQVWLWIPKNFLGIVIQCL